MWLLVVCVLVLWVRIFWLCRFGWYVIGMCVVWCWGWWLIVVFCLGVVVCCVGDRWCGVVVVCCWCLVYVIWWFGWYLLWVGWGGWICFWFLCFSWEFGCWVCVVRKWCVCWVFCWCFLVVWCWDCWVNWWCVCCVWFVWEFCVVMWWWCCFELYEWYLLVCC